MHRRNILWAAFSAIGAGFAASRANAATDATPQARLKVVYHLSDLDKVNFVLGNIQNHFDGVGGPDNVTIALVVHGQALRAFHQAQANPDITRRVGAFSKAGLEFAACGNTMKSQKITLQDLLPGFVSADKGGVVRIAELQSQGYLYLRLSRGPCCQPCLPLAADSSDATNVRGDIAPAPRCRSARIGVDLVTTRAARNHFIFKRKQR